MRIAIGAKVRNATMSGVPPRVPCRHQAKEGYCTKNAVIMSVGAGMVWSGVGAFMAARVA